jgi:succinate dehydrogenase / fumarate reductase membrane anchor subunit
MTAPRMRSPLGQAIGLGSAKQGSEHWWAQRVSAIALVPLTLWLVAAIVRLARADLRTFYDWLGRPVPAIAMVLLLIAAFYHAALGLQVVIEDYVHAEGAKLTLLIVMRLACMALAVAGIFAVLRIALAA